MSADSDARKQRAAHAALDYIEDGAVIGVGTGSTVNFFIDALGSSRTRVRAAVSSSNATTARLRALGIEVLDLNTIDGIGVYIDGADEATRTRHLIKGAAAHSPARRSSPPLRRGSSASPTTGSSSHSSASSHSHRSDPHGPRPGRPSPRDLRRSPGVA